MKDFKCLCCNKDLQYLDMTDNKSAPEIAMINGGIVGKISAGYGSRLDGDEYYVAICDSCVRDEVKRGLLKFAGNYLFPHLREPQELK